MLRKRRLANRLRKMLRKRKLANRQFSFVYSKFRNVQLRPWMLD